MRPSNWENPYEHGITAMEQAREDAFEAGADAMLEGLKKEGIKIDLLDKVRLFVNDRQFVLFHTPDIKTDCYIVSIPEEE